MKTLANELKRVLLCAITDYLYLTICSVNISLVKVNMPEKNSIAAV